MTKTKWNFCITKVYNLYDSIHHSEKLLSFIYFILRQKNLFETNIPKQKHNYTKLYLAIYSFESIVTCSAKVYSESEDNISEKSTLDIIQNKAHINISHLPHISFKLWKWLCHYSYSCTWGHEDMQIWP